MKTILGEIDILISWGYGTYRELEELSPREFRDIFTARKDREMQEEIRKSTG